jgi:hypothetical protein
MFKYKKKKIILQNGGTRNFYYKISSNGKKIQVSKKKYLEKKGGFNDPKNNWEAPPVMSMNNFNNLVKEKNKRNNIKILTPNEETFLSTYNPNNPSDVILKERLQKDFLEYVQNRGLSNTYMKEHLEKYKNYQQYKNKQNEKRKKLDMLFNPIVEQTQQIIKPAMRKNELSPPKITNNYYDYITGLDTNLKTNESRSLYLKQLEKLKNIKPYTKEEDIFLTSFDPKYELHRLTKERLRKEAINMASRNRGITQINLNRKYGTPNELSPPKITINNYDYITGLDTNLKTNESRSLQLEQVEKLKKIKPFTKEEDIFLTSFDPKYELHRLTKERLRKETINMASRNRRITQINLNRKYGTPNEYREYKEHLAKIREGSKPLTKEENNNLERKRKENQIKK